MASTANVVANMVEVESTVEEELFDDTAARAAKARRVVVLEVFTGLQHELPGDTATRDARTLAHFSYPSGAVLPLVMRPPGEAFYVCGGAAPELFGTLVHRCT